MARKSKRNNPNLNETQCPVCGKTFFPSGQHVYKDYRSRNRNVCSYKCVLISERLKEEEAACRKALREQKKAGGKA